ncbi:uncharacterized protein LOC128894197 isoform X1 [Hylaeus anthracinus]|uniref:uncharacterized protein LOC128894197 isoform X1 n=1 Tax=Hylaeus anthracinus TaxID=313031 RepID=UPI0023B9AAC3|nr:uncharacterized protein LOC128894197 isoform X1 [Hylaeus anthracinus]
MDQPFQSNRVSRTIKNSTILPSSSYLVLISTTSGVAISRHSLPTMINEPTMLHRRGASLVIGRLRIRCEGGQGDHGDERWTLSAEDVEDLICVYRVSHESLP